MKFVKILGASLALALAGCASFTMNEVAPVTMPSMASYTNKPNVFVEFMFYQGLPTSASAIEVSAAREELKPKLQKLLTDSELFGRVTMDEFEKQPGDYKLRLKVYNHPANGGELFFAFISGLTLGVVPAMAHDQYSMSLEVLDAQGQRVGMGNNHDGVETWMGILILPLVAYTPRQAVTDTFGRQVNALLKQMVEQNQVKYSSLKAVETRG
ncbi:MULTISPECIES: hypothetical protein [unclassified Pseudomonas]|uniref:hypothetical protein n=1 Tax=unclassified Pseudomonas TaxID=196821 RepID=UPI000838A622|nr:MULTISPECIES: hypothetical protein [unclassified Pseudomonas]QIH08813.1 hypothetical protein ATY02_19790 [Pseudomonas sp. BIOMIG1BAC]